MLTRKQRMRNLMLLLAILSLIGCNRPTPGPIPPPDQDIVKHLIDLHNYYRAQHNLPPLIQNQKLQAAANKHGAYQAQVGHMAHFGIGDGTPGSRITAEGYNWSSYGENVAWNQADAETVMKTWMWSPGHRWNILSNYQEIGASMYKGKNGDPYWTVDFGTTAAGQPTAEPMPTEIGPGLIPPVSESR